MSKFIEITITILIAGGGGYLFAHFRRLATPTIKQPPSDVYQWLFENGVKADPKAVMDLLDIIKKGLPTK